MRSRFLLWIGLLGLLVAPVAADQRYILQVDSSQLADITARYGLQVISTTVVGGAPVALVSCPQPLSSTALTQLAQEAAVSGVDDDQDLDVPEGRPAQPSASVSTTAAAIQDALTKSSPATYYGSTVRLAYSSQPATTLIATGAAHEGNETIGAGTVVAVIDTGVDPTHPALQNVLVPGYDFTREAPGTPSEWLDLAPSATATALAQSTVAILDQKNSPAVLNQSTVAILDQSTVAILDATQLPSAFGHGTMVAGLIHLVAPGAGIMPLKAFRADGSSDLYQIVRAIYYAVDNGANVINMSFSVAQPSASMANAIQYATSHGVFCVASVGNDGQQVTVYPAGFGGVFGVGSTSMTDIRSTFSNYGSSAFTAAPGEGLITAYPGNNYAGVWGTSFSTGLVSGAVALAAGARPGISWSQMAGGLNAGVDIDQGMGRARLQVVMMLHAVSPN